MRALIASALLSSAILAPAALAQPGSEWRDPVKHSTQRVTVESGIELQVLDFGGTGRPLILLAGLGNTAHVFDDFARALTGKFHVYAVSRRGFGTSSAPNSGDSFARLGDDIAEVIAQLKLKKPLIVGHSFAGEEMHALAARHRGKIAGLVYIDAAFDRTYSPAPLAAKQRELPASPNPQPGDLASIDAFRAFTLRNGNTLFPEAEVRVSSTFDAAGAITGRKQPEPAVRQVYAALMGSTQKGYNPTPIAVPALALYAVPGKIDDLLRRYPDSTVRLKVDEYYALARDQYQHHSQWFRTFAGKSAQAQEMSGPHHLFLNNGDQVRAAIETFAASLPK